MDDTTTWDDLAAALGKDSRDLRRWRKKGAPQDFDIDAWRAWLLANTKSAAPVVASDAALPGGCDYDDLVKAGKLTYALAKIREQVVSESISNDTKRVELAKARGALVTKEEAERAVALMRDNTERRWQAALGRALGDQPNDVRTEILRRLELEMSAGE